ncbi:MAG: MGMT family protein [Deltaproteobacteria bacterium]|nr:MAG: MGMT family protein [Deltaproteobacteria bacterium]
MLLALSRLDSPVGRLVFAADDSLLRALEFYESEEQLRAKVERSLPGAGTPFQRKVWKALRTIQPGRTTSYRALAEQIGCPGAFRAVGAANGQNPISLVVPCHRVIAADGTLCGYGGGLWRKEWLLRHEGALLA